MAHPHQRMNKINETLTITLLGLGSLDVVTQGGLVTTQGGFCTSSQIMAFLDGLTVGEGQGLLLGVADGQLSASEIEEQIESQGPFFKGQTPQSEKAERMVRIVGEIGSRSSDLVPTLTEIVRFWRRFPTKLSFSEDKSNMFQWFIYNVGNAITTGATCKLHLRHNVRWSSA